MNVNFAIAKNCLVLKSMVDGQLNFNNYLEKILRKSVSRYMFRLELEFCVFQKKSY